MFESQSDQFSEPHESISSNLFEDVASILIADEKEAEDQQMRALLKDLDDEEFGVREKATKELRKFKDKALVLLVDTLLDENTGAEVKRRCRKLLGPLVEQHTPAHEKLESARLQLVEQKITPKEFARQARQVAEDLEEQTSTEEQTSKLLQQVAKLQKLHGGEKFDSENPNSTGNSMYRRFNELSAPRRTAAITLMDAAMLVVETDKNLARQLYTEGIVKSPSLADNSDYGWPIKSWGLAQDPAFMKELKKARQKK